MAKYFTQEVAIGEGMPKAIRTSDLTSEATSDTRTTSRKVDVASARKMSKGIRAHRRGEGVHAQCKASSEEEENGTDSCRSRNAQGKPGVGRITQGAEAIG